MRLFLFHIMLIVSINSFAADAANSVKPPEIKVSPAPAVSPKGASIISNANPVEMQYMWPAFSGPVTIEISFDKPKWIGKIQIHAYAAPTKNIDQARVDILNERKNTYETIDIINNKDSGTAEKKYSLSSKCISRKTKKVQLTLTPPYIDLPISFHHISVETYDTKPASWTTAAENNDKDDDKKSVIDDKNKIVISDQKWSVTFDKTNGRIIEILSSSNKTGLVKRLDTYALIQDKTTETLVQEGNNEVLECHMLKNNAVEFKCRLTDYPGIAINKKYILEKNRLIKRIEVVSETASTSPVFISFAERLILPNRRVKDVIFAGGDPWYSPRVWPCSIVCETRQFGAGVSHGLLFMDNTKDKADSLGLVRLLVNEKFVWPLSSAGSSPFLSCYYYPDGGRIPMTTFRLSNKPSSYEVALVHFQGDELDFVKRYSEIPVVAQQYAKIKRPAWLKDVLCMAWLTPAFAGDAERQVKDLLEMTSRGDILVVLNQPFVWADFGENPEFMNIWGAVIKQEDYKSLIARLKALSPRVKVALYTWIWTGSPASKFFSQNINAFVTHDKNGPISNAYPGLSPNFTRRMCDEKGYQNLAKQYRQLVNIYDVDFLYLDGGAGGSTGIDWGHGSVDQDYMWQNFYAYMRGLSEDYADGAMMFNSKCQPLADLGISEMGLDAFQKHPGYVTNRIWGGKIQEAVDPLHRTVPVYWGYSDPYYSNVCVGMGLVPCIEGAGLSNVEPDFIRIKAPVLSLAREMLNCKPLGLIPGLFPDSNKSKIDGYSLVRNNSLIMSLINREGKATEIELTLPLERSELSPDSIYHVWQNDMRDPASIKDIFSEAQQIEAYRNSRWTLQRTVDTKYLGVIKNKGHKFNVKLNSKLLTLVTCSQSCAVIMSVDGLPLKIRQSSALGVTLNGIIHGDTVNLDVISESPVKQIDVLLALPPKKILQDAAADGLFNGYTWKDGKCFAVLSLQGNKSYKFRLIDCPDRTGPVSTKCPDIVVPGQTLCVEIKDPGIVPLSMEIVKDSQTISIYPVNDGKVSLTIPRLARAGEYEMRIVAPDSSVPLLQKTVCIQNAIPIPYNKPELPKPSGPEIEVVKDPIVSRTALSGGGGNRDNGRQMESLDLNKRELLAGILERPFSRWGYSCAGMELRRARWLKLKVESNISSAYCIEPRRKGYDGPFAGLVIDYKTADKYTRRVVLNFGLGKFHWKAPEYGKGGTPDEQIELEKWIAYQDKKDIALDLQKWAPANWDGTCWVSVFAGHLLQGRFVKVKFDNVAWDKKPLWASSVADIEQNTKLPLTLPTYDVQPVKEKIVIDGKALEKSWSDSSLLTDFRILGNPQKRIGQKTQCRLMYDDENLYLFFECTEKPENSVKSSRSSELWYDDSVEILLADEKSKKSSLHIVANAGGILWSDVKGVVATAAATISPGMWTVEIQIPLKAVSMTKPAQNVHWRANLCRNRPIRIGEPPDEFFCWARIENGNYSQVERYGILNFK